MTIEQIQAAIDAKADARQIINMIADYIQANPGGGGGITLYSGNGTISSDRTVDLNGNLLTFEDDGKDLLEINPVTFNTYLVAGDIDAQYSGIEFFSDLLGTNVSFYLNAYDGGTGVNIRGNGIDNTIEANAGGQQSLYLDGTGFLSRLIGQDGTASSALTLRGDSANTAVSFQLQAKTTALGALTLIIGDAVAQTITITAANGVIVTTSEFADNAAAITGGLAVGTIYRTGDLMKTVH